MFVFYESSQNPTGLTGTVGGTATTTPLSGYLGEVFTHVTAPPSGTQTGFQYRKVFVKNEYSADSTLTRVWLDAVEHPDQITLDLEATAGDTSLTPTGEPASVTGWSAPGNYAEGISLGTLSANTSTGLWIRQALSNITHRDPYATFRLYVGGIIE
jgi:hypothetical protein